jgi:hypothetical protein
MGSQREIAAPHNVQGMEIGGETGPDAHLLRIISDMLTVTAQLKDVDRTAKESGQRSLSMALSASTQAVNALLSVAAVQCHLSQPPQEVEVKLNASGNLIYRCYHTPPHEWDLTGRRLP